MIIAANITIGGESASAWFGADPTTDARADVSEEGSHIVKTKKTEDGKELPVSITGEQREKVLLDLSHVSG